MPSEISTSAAFMRILSSKFTFEIDYLKSKDLPIGKCTSQAFTVGGYDWVLEFYPQGFVTENQGSHVSLYLILKSEANDITAEYSFQLLDKLGNSITIGKDEIDTFVGHDSVWGYDNFITRDEIENLYCQEGILTIFCNMKVLTEPTIVRNYPGGLCEHIEKLWKDRERFDVVFEVEGESIPAHKFMLATRSPVFAAELFGSMAEAKMEHVKIDEMEAEVFKALLHFVYTDKLLVNESTSGGASPVELLQGLFVAADRYDLGKLSLMCVEQLEKKLSIKTVAKTLVLADRHSRAGAGLKNKCLKFASAPMNFYHIARTQEYFQIMQDSPALFAELSEMVDNSQLALHRSMKTD